MKTTLNTFVGICLVISLAMCNSVEGYGVKNIKDLDDNMIDLRMYHENLGDAIVKKNQDEAIWLYTGMDSLLNVISDKFYEHRKLVKPFRESYVKDLLPQIKNIGRSLESENWTEAAAAYTLLTRKCNGCHKDRDVDKIVQNWLERRKNQ